MLLLCDRVELYRRMPGGVAVEVGVQFGANAQSILCNCHLEKLYLVDCWEAQDSEDPSNEVDQEQAYQTVMNRHGADSRVSILRMYSENAAAVVESLDWVYIDADHTLKAVERDLRLWWPKVKRGGFLCGHDYIAERFGKKYSYIQVKEAVDQFCAELGTGLHFLTDEKYGSWAIHKELR